LQKDAFVLYLSETGHTKTDMINDTKIERLEMDWRTKNNHTDCGLFTMRHMEVYMGEEGKDWKAGFVKEEDKEQNEQIKDLRKKYAAKILLHDLNEAKEYVIQDMKDYMKLPGYDRRKMQLTSKNRIQKRLKDEVDS
jgi:Ulp1 family protease